MSSSLESDSDFESGTPSKNRKASSQNDSRNKVDSNSETTSKHSGKRERSSWALLLQQTKQQSNLASKQYINPIVDEKLEELIAKKNPKSILKSPKSAGNIGDMKQQERKHQRVEIKGSDSSSSSEYSDEDSSDDRSKANSTNASPSPRKKVQFSKKVQEKRLSESSTSSSDSGSETDESSEVDVSHNKSFNSITTRDTDTSCVTLMDSTITTTPSKPKEINELIQTYISENGCTQFNKTTVDLSNLKSSDEVYLVKITKGLHPQLLTDTLISFDKATKLKIEDSSYTLDIKKQKSNVIAITSANGDFQSTNLDLAGSMIINNDATSISKEWNVKLVQEKDMEMSKNVKIVQEIDPKNREETDKWIFEQIRTLIVDYNINHREKQKKKKKKKSKEKNLEENFDIFRLLDQHNSMHVEEKNSGNSTSKNKCKREKNEEVDFSSIFEEKQQTSFNEIDEGFVSPEQAAQESISEVKKKKSKKKNHCENIQIEEPQKTESAMAQASDEFILKNEKKKKSSKNASLEDFHQIDNQKTNAGEKTEWKKVKRRHSTYIPNESEIDNILNDFSFNETKCKKSKTKSFEELQHEEPQEIKSGGKNILKKTKKGDSLLGPNEGRKEVYENLSNFRDSSFGKTEKRRNSLHVSNTSVGEIDENISILKDCSLIEENEATNKVGKVKDRKKKKGNSKESKNLELVCEDVSLILKKNKKNSVAKSRSEEVKSNSLKNEIVDNLIPLGHNPPKKHKKKFKEVVNSTMINPADGTSFIDQGQSVSNNQELDDIDSIISSLVKDVDDSERKKKSKKRKRKDSDPNLSTKKAKL